jgi:hypothetical protein
MKQLELKLQISDRRFEDIPTLKELIERKKERPKHLQYLSNKHYELVKQIYKGKF